MRDSRREGFSGVRKTLSHPGWAGLPWAGDQRLGVGLGVEGRFAQLRERRRGKKNRERGEEEGQRGGKTTRTRCGEKERRRGNDDCDTYYLSVSKHQACAERLTNVNFTHPAALRVGAIIAPIFQMRRPGLS